MTAPAHLRGRMSVGTDWRIRAERHRWIVAQRDAGISCAHIGAALGISAGAVSDMSMRPEPTNPHTGESL